MKELTKTKRITISSVLFFAIIVIGVISVKNPELRYSLSPQETLDQIMMFEDEMFPEDVLALVEYEEPGYVYIDIRTPYEFIKGHIANAINIDVSDILEKDNLKLLKRFEEDSLTVVMYGKDQLQANGAWMVLKQLGFNNIKVMLGGWDYYSIMDPYEMPEIPEYFVEEPKYPFGEIMMEAMYNSMMDDSEEIQEVEVVQPVRRKKTTVVEGGC